MPAQARPDEQIIRAPALGPTDDGESAEPSFQGQHAGAGRGQVQAQGNAAARRRQRHGGVSRRQGGRAQEDGEAARAAARQGGGGSQGRERSGRGEGREGGGEGGEAGRGEEE